MVSTNPQIVKHKSGLKASNRQVFRVSDRKSALEWDHSEHQSNSTGLEARPDTGQRLSISRRSEEREKKVATTLCIVTSVFVGCWSPFIIVYSIYITEDVERIHVLLNEALIWLGLSNSAMNPIIYAYFVPQFRQTFKRIVFRKH